VKVTKDKVENSQAYLTIEMEPVELEAGLAKAYRRLVQKANIPGFRKGKAPRSIVEQYLGKESLLEDAVNNMASDACEKALEEQGLKIVARPEIDVEKLDPVTYKVVAPLQPTVKLGDYHSIRIAQESVELKEEEVTKTLENIRHQHATWEPVERQVNTGDMVSLDIDSHVGEQRYIDLKGTEYEVTKDSQFPVVGFAEQLVGLKRDETKEFKLSFPKDYAREELAGKEADFKVTIKEIKQERLPELNDDLAKQVNPEYKTVDDLKKYLTDYLKERAEDKARKEYEQKVVDAAVEQSQVEYPPVLVEEEIDQMIREQMRRWQMNDKGMDDYLKSIKKTGEQLREEIRPAAVKSVKQSLVMTQVAQDEKIEITNEETEAEIENMTKSIAEEGKQKMLELLSVPQARASLISVIATRKTVQKLVDIAKSEPEKTAPVEAEQQKEVTNEH
jgi:trigger factor